MKFKLEIEMDNAAFEHPSEEISRLLFEHAELIANERIKKGSKAEIHDYNGNKVGAWKVTK